MAFKSKFGKFFGFGKSEAEDTVLEEKVEKATICDGVSSLKFLLKELSYNA